MKPAGSRRMARRRGARSGADRKRSPITCARCSRSQVVWAKSTRRQRGLTMGRAQRTERAKLQLVIGPQRAGMGRLVGKEHLARNQLVTVPAGVVANGVTGLAKGAAQIKGVDGCQQPPRRAVLPAAGTTLPE